MADGTPSKLDFELAIRQYWDKYAEKSMEDIRDSFERELRFYKRALAATVAMGGALLALGGWMGFSSTELAGFGDHDGGSEDLRDPYHDSAVGATLPSRIRKAQVPLRSARRRIVEDGRNRYKGSWTLGIPVRAVDKAGQMVDFFLSRTGT